MDEVFDNLRAAVTDAVYRLEQATYGAVRYTRLRLPPALYAVFTRGVEPTATHVLLPSPGTPPGNRVVWWVAPWCSLTVIPDATAAPGGELCVALP